MTHYPGNSVEEKGSLLHLNFDVKRALKATSSSTILFNVLKETCPGLQGRVCKSDHRLFKREEGRVEDLNYEDLRQLSKGTLRMVAGNELI